MTRHAALRHVEGAAAGCRRKKKHDSAKTGATGARGNQENYGKRFFPEDTKEFLDYYYFVKTGINEIYVIEADGEIPVHDSAQSI